MESKKPDTITPPRVDPWRELMRSTGARWAGLSRIIQRSLIEPEAGSGSPQDGCSGGCVESTERVADKGDQFGVGAIMHLGVVRSPNNALGTEQVD